MDQPHDGVGRSHHSRRVDPRSCAFTARAGEPLPGWCNPTNDRGHAALGEQSPAGRVPNLRGQNTSTWTPRRGSWQRIAGHDVRFGQPGVASLHAQLSAPHDALRWAQCTQKELGCAVDSLGEADRTIGRLARHWPRPLPRPARQLSRTPMGQCSWHSVPPV